MTTRDQTLLKDAYGLRWSLPRGAESLSISACRQYLRHVAELLSDGSPAAIPRGRAVTVLDIGTGASCMVPMVGASEYGWRFVGTEIDKPAMHWARQIVRVNLGIARMIECRLQPSPLACFAGVVNVGERFDASMCNPPLHPSADTAAAEFIERMIVESAERPRLCRWFTTLVPKREHLPHLRRLLRQTDATATTVKGRMLAWTF